MSAKTSRLVYVIELGKMEGKINEGLIALWTGLGPSATYMLMKQIKQLCESGKLNDNNVICTIEGNEVVFKKKDEVR